VGSMRLHRLVGVSERLPCFHMGIKNTHAKMYLHLGLSKQAAEGLHKDAVRIVREVVRAFPRATCGLVVSEWTFNQLQYQQQLLESRSGLVLVEHCHVGPNRLVVLRADIH
jgi:hypothetical protein